MRGALVSVALVLASCSSVDGRFRGEAGTVADWTLRPNHCDANPFMLAGFATTGTVDLYYRGDGAKDTEVVVNGQLPDPRVLVRIPDTGKMAVLRAADCAVFQVDVHEAGYTVNDEAPLTGRVRLDCQQPEIGHVAGEATFTCL